ncbi:MAG: 2-isopropylmalate synthase [Verrucomicrobiaceae bacterium]|nr:2-isopropylmalate synthase [Verrucomicrobiaceae bacterium]
MKDFSGKYTRRFNFKIENRQWPDKHIERAPIWCSVDLRDGNQALAIPMGVDEKMKLYNTLLNVGFKEIEVGFPAASDTEFKFLRKLIDENLIPEGVTVQVLTQAREHLIKKTFEALKGCKSAIVHLYNSTSALQRKVTFNMSREEIIEIARQGARLVRAMADEAEANGTHIRLEYSPESFSDTELDFALEICEEVKAIWKPTPENKIIINLPETVQYNPPNIYADQIEWMSTHISDRDCVEISLHAHNDRGTGVAATELALTAGADRVEGTLFGNGERTGNLDIVTVALNMYAEGIESGLDFSNLPEVKRVYEECTRMQVPPRHPYAGDLVFTAFSGSHQDAIKKGMDLRRKNNINSWEVPYLLIDPTDVGCSYEAIIRINSQSGKGGVAYVLSDKFHLELPKAMHQQVGDFVNSEADKLGKELSPDEIYDIFKSEFIQRTHPLKLVSYHDERYGNSDSHEVKIFAQLLLNGEEIEISAVGNGPVNAFVNALESKGLKNFRLIDYCSHAIGSGSATNSAAYICLESNDDKRKVWGVGMHSNIEHAALDALVCAVNRL